MNIRILLALAAALSLSALAGCSSAPEKPAEPAPVVSEPPPPPPPVAAPEPTPPSVPVTVEEEKPAPAPRQIATKTTLAAGVLFEFNRALLKPEGKAKLDELAGQAKSLNDLEVVIGIGHADRLGPKKYNQKLSVRRAEAVKAYLVTQGVDSSRIRTEGRGESQPVTKCDNKRRKELIACLAPNRRVEIEVIGTRME
jgi:OOP family OmpA-OmpF porin